MIYKSIDTNNSPQFSILDGLKLLCEPGATYELRCPKTKKGTISGFFTDLERMADHADFYSGDVPSVYFTLNPVKPDYLALANNKVKEYAHATTPDNGIVSRRLLLIDADPVREPKEISSTDEEHNAALERILDVRDWLRKVGLPGSLFADSGNGGHAIYRVSLPNDDDATSLVGRFLKALAERFSDAKVTIDTTVHNAARISKVYGTMACKGDPIPGRPHRMAHIFEVPDDFVAVSRELIEQVARGSKPTTVPVTETLDRPKLPVNKRPAVTRKGEIDIPVWIEKHGLGIYCAKSYKNGYKWALNRCPFNEQHVDGSCAIYRFPNGIRFKCSHNSCQNKHWPDVQNLYGEFVDLPAIVVNNRPLWRITEDAIAAIEDANVPAQWFKRGGIMTRLRTDTDSPQLEALGQDALKGVLCRVANWKRGNKEKGYIHVSPPDDVVRDLLNLPDWTLPRLTAITESPMFVGDGELISRPGYDAKTCLWFAPGDALTLQPVADRPTQADIERAKELLLTDLLGDFPFAGAADKANALALLLLPFVRLMVDGPTPLHVIDAPTEGTGKGLLVDCLALPAIGREAERMTPCHNDDEWRKTLTSALIKAPVFVLLDNVDAPLSSASLASLLTARHWQDRLLGGNRMVDLPVSCVWLATGNNVKASKEITRRIVRIRLDANLEHPNTRSGFKHPKLLTWAKANRTELIGAALTLVKAWIVAGRPPGNQTWGSYESWAATMGGILDVVGVPGFLSNWDTLFRDVNTSDGEWREFILAWWDRWQDAPLSPGDALNLANEHGLLDAALGDGSDRSRAVKMGFALQRQTDKVYGEFRVTRAGKDGHTKRGLFRLLPLKQEPDELPPITRDRPTLAEVTAGRLPFDLPYEVRDFPNGSRNVVFRRLTEFELMRLDLDTGSQLATLRDGRNSLSLPRIVARSA